MILPSFVHFCETLFAWPVYPFDPAPLQLHEAPLKAPPVMVMKGLQIWGAGAETILLKGVQVYM